MALYLDFADPPHIILDPAIRSLAPGRRKLAVKVVDIFGNDTMKIIEVKA